MPRRTRASRRQIRSARRPDLGVDRALARLERLRESRHPVPANEDGPEAHAAPPSDSDDGGRDD